MTRSSGFSSSVPLVLCPILLLQSSSTWSHHKYRFLCPSGEYVLEYAWPTSFPALNPYVFNPSFYFNTFSPSSHPHSPHAVSILALPCKSQLISSEKKKSNIMWPHLSFSPSLCFPLALFLCHLSRFSTSLFL